MTEDYINPSRMELTRLKNQLSSVSRGHRLLKDKQDGLTKQFLVMINRYKELRSSVESSFISILSTYNNCHITLDSTEIFEKLMIPSNIVDIKFLKANILGVDYPTFKINTKSIGLSYGLHFSNINLDKSILSLAKLFPQMLKLAETEKQCRLFAKEIQKTKRRVNSIEHFMIPKIESQIKFISAKLNETERSNITRSMKSKEILETKKDTKNEPSV